MTLTRGLLDAALAQNVPTVLDGGALGRRADARRAGAAHAARRRAEPPDRPRRRGDPRRPRCRGPARRARTRRDGAAEGPHHSDRGTVRASAGDGQLLRVRSAPSWLATAGAGDALAGILGALLATHHEQLESDPGLLAPLAATGARAARPGRSAGQRRRTAHDSRPHCGGVRRGCRPSAVTLTR